MADRLGAVGGLYLGETVTLICVNWSTSLRLCDPAPGRGICSNAAFMAFWRYLSRVAKDADGVMRWSIPSESEAT